MPAKTEKKAANKKAAADLQLAEAEKFLKKFQASEKDGSRKKRATAAKAASTIHTTLASKKAAPAKPRAKKASGKASGKK